MELLERVVIMFNDMWFRHQDTFKNPKWTIKWWKGMLRLINFLHILQPY